MILRMDHKLQHVTLLMFGFDQFYEMPQRGLAVATTLIALVNEEVEYPVLVRAARFVGKRHESDHRGTGIDGIWKPCRAAETEVGFGERDCDDGSVLGDESLLIGMNSQA